MRSAIWHNLFCDRGRGADRGDGRMLVFQEKIKNDDMISAQKVHNRRYYKIFLVIVKEIKVKILHKIIYIFLSISVISCSLEKMTVSAEKTSFSIIATQKMFKNFYHISNIDFTEIQTESGKEVCTFDEIYFIILNRKPNKRCSLIKLEKKEQIYTMQINIPQEKCEAFRSFSEKEFNKILEVKRKKEKFLNEYYINNQNDKSVIPDNIYYYCGNGYLYAEIVI